MSDKMKCDEEIEYDSSDSLVSVSSFSIDSEAGSSHDEPQIPNRKRKAEAISPADLHEVTERSSKISLISDSQLGSRNTRVTSFTYGKFRRAAIQLDSSSKDPTGYCPLPKLNWADEKELWRTMMAKEKCYPRDPNVMKRHPELSPRMRCIVLDWLVEVCDAYGLHRETFCLAQDYIDRFLAARSNFPKGSFQLLGVTALFVAAKMEEIYPPKLDDFAVVTDEACTQADIVQQELILVMTLNWSLNPVTVNSWLNIFLQLAYLQNGENLMGPEKYGKGIFIRISQVLDLCCLDIDSLKFPYSILTASAMTHILSMDVALTVSGYSYADLSSCIAWMENFVDVALKKGFHSLKYVKDVKLEDLQNIQLHMFGLSTLDEVHELQKQPLSENSSTTKLGLLTPPLSAKNMNEENIMRK